MSLRSFGIVHNRIFLELNILESNNGCIKVNLTALIVYSTFDELVSAPYSNQTSGTNFSKTTRQKLKVKVYSDRARLSLYEHIITFNFYRRIFVKLVFLVLV